MACFATTFLLIWDIEGWDELGVFFFKVRDVYVVEWVGNIIEFCRGYRILCKDIYYLCKYLYINL